MPDSIVISASLADVAAPVPLCIDTSPPVSGASFGPAFIWSLDNSTYEAQDKRSKGRHTRPSFRLNRMISRLLVQAGLAPEIIGGPRTGLVSGSHFGCAQVYDMHNRLRRHGPRGIDAIRFAQATHNYPVSAAAIDFGLQGPCFAIVSTKAAGLDALTCALDWLNDDRCDRVIVAAFEDFTPELTAVLDQKRCRNSAQVFSESMVLMLLERQSTAAARGLHHAPALASLTRLPFARQTRPTSQAGRHPDTCPDPIDYLGAHGLVALHRYLAASGHVGKSGTHRISLMPDVGGVTLEIVHPQMELC